MNNQDFTTSKGSFDNFFGKDAKDERPQTQPGDFVSHNQPSMNYSQQMFANNYMNMANPNAMFYPPFSNEYMSYGYNYGSSPYKGHKGGYEKRNTRHGGYRKHQGSGYSVQQVIYAKKPKQPLKADGDFLAEDFKKLNIRPEDKSASPEKGAGTPETAKFFVIKSYSEEDVVKAIKHNVWCSTRDGNLKLHDAFVTANNAYPIFLLFSVNASGHFVGIAQMKSPVDFEKNFPGWNQSHKWKGVFKISWTYIKDVPNRELRHLKNPLNEDKPVPNSRDTQEIPFEVGTEVLDLFLKYKNETSILDDFDYYENRETGK